MRFYFICQEVSSEFFRSLLGRDATEQRATGYINGINENPFHAFPSYSTQLFPVAAPSVKGSFFNHV